MNSTEQMAKRLTESVQWLLEAEISRVNMVASQIAMDRRGCQKLYIRAEVVSPSFAEIAKSTWNAWLKGDTIS